MKKQILQPDSLLPPATEEEIQPQKNQIKLKPSPTQVGRPQNNPEFEEIADEAVKLAQERNEKAYCLAQSFISSLDDKTLQHNKSEAQKQIEMSIIKQLVEFAQVLNEDDSADKDGNPILPICYGTNSMLLLVFKAFLKQRDRINKLEAALNAVPIR